jgi:hypothetical protein
MSDSGSTYWGRPVYGRNRRTRNPNPIYNSSRNSQSSLNEIEQNSNRSRRSFSESNSVDDNSEITPSIDSITDDFLDSFNEDISIVQLSNAMTEIQNHNPNPNSPNTSTSDIIRNNIGIIHIAAYIWVEEKFKTRGFYTYVREFLGIPEKYKNNIQNYFNIHDKDSLIQKLLDSYKENNTRRIIRDIAQQVFHRAHHHYSNSIPLPFLSSSTNNSLLFNNFSNSSSSSSSSFIQASPPPAPLSYQNPEITHTPVQSTDLPDSFLISENNFPHQRPIKFIPKRLHHSWIEGLIDILENFIEEFNKDKELEKSLDLFNFPTKFMSANLPRVHQQILTIPTNPEEEEDQIKKKKRFMLRKVHDNIQHNQPGVATEVLKSFVDNREPINDYASNPVLLQKMKDLHPQPAVSPNLVLPNLFDLDQCQFNFPEESVRKLVSHLPKLKANGFSAWTFDLISQSFKIDSSNRISLLFTQVFNLLASGKARHKHLWISSRLLAISKDDPNSIRPIAIGEVFIRIVGKLIALYLLGLEGVLTALHNSSQFGVGVKGGNEVIAHSLTIAYQHIAAINDEYSIISIDNSNAFNTICRKAILDSILEHCPCLAVFYLWMYGESSNLYDGHGKFICHSATGVRQGDPLGPLLFALGIAPILTKLKRDFPELEILAFLDDVYKFGKTSDCEEAFMVMKQAFGDINLSINIKKCKHLTKSAETRDKFIPLENNSEMSFYSIPIVKDGLSVLKVPIGNREFVQESTAVLVNGYTRIVELVDRLNPDDAFTIIKLCVNPCPNYLARCVKPDYWNRQIARFDRIIDRSIAKIADIRVSELNQFQKTLRHLPQDKGGLGISSYHHLAPSAWTASFYNSLPHIESYFERLYSKVLEFKDRYVGFDQKQVERFNQKKLCSIANQSIYNTFLGNFSDSEKQAKATFLSSATHGTSKFLSSNYSNVYSFVGLNSEDFREGVRKRLLLLPLTPPARYTCRCVGSESSDDYHVFRCQKYQGFWTKRHDLVRDHLVKLCKAVRPNAIVTKEQNLGRYKSPTSTHRQRELRCDIMITEGTEKFIIDVAVTEPTCEEAIRKGSWNTPLIASDDREKVKNADYKKFLTPEMFQYFVPFALESTGRMGKSAIKFLDRLCKLDKMDLEFSESVRVARQRFLHSVSNILVATSAHVARLTRHREAAVT